MTQSTGANDRQKRREELFWGELRLTRMRAHLMEKLAILYPAAPRAADCYLGAILIVEDRLDAVRREWAELPR